MIECIRFKQFNSGNLVGFADLKFPNMGIEIFGCKVFTKNGGKWVNLPDREYQNENHEKKWAPILRFTEKQHFEAFKEQAIEAVEKFISDSDMFVTASPASELEPPPF